MKTSDLNQFFEQNPQFDKNAWLALAKPCFDISFVEQDIHQNSSYFGGAPYLPVDFRLPETPKGIEYQFFAQINFADLPSDNPLRSQFPQTGILSLFYQTYREDWEMGDKEPFFGDDNYVVAYYFDEKTERVLHQEKMSMLYDGTVIHAKSIVFEYGLNMPCCHYLKLDYPDNQKLRDEFFNLFSEYEEEKQAPDYLAGYPSFYSLGYDPTPEVENETWLPFLTLESHDDLAWCWQDGNKLMAFIEQKALAKSDFGQIKTDAG